MKPNSDAELHRETLKLRELYLELEGIIDHQILLNDCSIESIGTQMQKIQETEKTLQPLREAFRSEHAGGPKQNQMSPELQSATDQVIELVNRIMPKLAQMEKAAQEAIKRLVPDIQSGVRAVQMQSAYSASR